MKVICALIINVKLCSFASFCRLAKINAFVKKKGIKKKERKTHAV